MTTVPFWLMLALNYRPDEIEKLRAELEAAEADAERARQALRSDVEDRISMLEQIALDRDDHRDRD